MNQVRHLSPARTLVGVLTWLIPTLYICFLPHGVEAGNYTECVDAYYPIDPTELETFISDQQETTHKSISINGELIPESLTSDYMLWLSASSYICLQGMRFIVGQTQHPSLVKLVLRHRQSRATIIDVGFYGNRNLLNLVPVRGKVQIRRGTFAQSESCVNIPHDGTVTWQKVTMYNCGISRGGKTYRNQRIRLTFKQSHIYLLTASALHSYLTIAEKGKAIYLPKVAFLQNTFWVRTEKHAARLMIMLNKRNVQCIRNKIVVFGDARHKKGRCAEIVPATKADRDRFKRVKNKLGPVKRTEWLLAELLSAQGGRGGERDGSGGGGSESKVPSGEGSTGMLPFLDGTFFSDGTGWMDLAR